MSGLFKPDPSLLTSGSTFHDNVTQTYITITEDKLRNFLNEFREAYSSVVGWAIPFGIFVSLGTALFTANFRRMWGFSEQQWEAIFTAIFLMAGAWTAVMVWRAVQCKKTASVECLIRKIKNDPEI